MVIVIVMVIVTIMVIVIGMVIVTIMVIGMGHSVSHH